MKQRNQTMLKTLGVAMMLVGANATMALETVTVPASVTVNNAIDFTFTGTLDFGQVRATADDTDATCAGLNLPANPASSISAQITPSICTAGIGTAVMQPVGGTPSRPVFTIAGAAPFTQMTITVPFEPIPLTANTGPDTPQFDLSAFTAHKTNGTPAPITISAVDGTGSIQTDATGNATFTVGATLSTHNDDSINSTNYQDLAYNGSFDVSVDY